MKDEIAALDITNKFTFNELLTRYQGLSPSERRDIDRWAAGSEQLRTIVAMFRKNLGNRRTRRANASRSRRRARRN